MRPGNRGRHGGRRKSSWTGSGVILFPRPWRSKLPAPAQGHTGFDRLVVGEDASMDASYYAHYLHHKYFEVNYADGMVPLDKWFGSFHDGTPEAHEAMKARRRRRGARIRRRRCSWATASGRASSWRLWSIWRPLREMHDGSLPKDGKRRRRASSAPCY